MGFGPHLYIYALTFIFGAFVGSFLNLVSDRLINGGSILFGRSHCDFCKKSLTMRNLIPVFSFLLQKGKCSFCNKKLSWYYPISEIITGGLFVYSVSFSGILLTQTPRGIWDLIFLFVIFSLFIVLFLTDAKYQLLPDLVVYWAIGLTFLFVILGYILSLYSLYNRLINDTVLGKYLIKVGYMDLQIKNSLMSVGILLASSIGIALFFQFLVWVTKEKGMGQGDVKLGLLIGLFNGFPQNIIAIFLGFVFGAIYSMFLIVFGKKTMKDTVPFGPFLILGSLVSLAYGSYLLNWYIHLF